MKNAAFLIVLLSVIIIGGGSADAQSYSTAIGARFGGATSGITIKHFISRSTNLEGIVSFAPHSFLITGLYEFNSAISGAPGLNLMYGFGGHVGFFGNGGRYYAYRDKYYNDASVFGVDGIIGLDYKFKSAPINLTLDIKPFVDFYSGTSLFLDGAFSIRLTL